MEGTMWGDQALDSTEAAEYCGISRQNWWQNYKGWKVPHVHVGGRPCFLKGDLDKWLEERNRRLSKTHPYLFNRGAA
jgi:hypothetical protein